MTSGHKRDTTGIGRFLRVLSTR